MRTLAAYREIDCAFSYLRTESAAEAEKRTKGPFSGPFQLTNYSGGV